MGRTLGERIQTAAGRPASIPFSPLERGVCLFLLLVVILLLQGDAPPPGALETRLYPLVADIRFHFWEWEVRALWEKFTLWLLQPQRYMTEADRSAFLREWVAQVEEVQRLERRISDLYADPSVQNPDEATAALRRERARLRRAIALRQPIAEAILEEQVGVVLARDASGLLGQPLPQVGIHITPLPLVLVVSLRERIALIEQEELVPGLGVDEQEALEKKVDETLGVSSLVTPIGGMSAWPAMVLEHPDLVWWTEVTAHEWVHHYLYFFPLGWFYEENWEVRAINETVASIVGQEIARRTILRYYPDLEPPEEPVPEEEEEAIAPPAPAQRPTFDFRAEMYETRVRVDTLLLQGRIEEAERYMEQRRRVFWEHGYRIRKLNQAYFAFYGSYAAAPGGAAGKDPVGPAVRQLWRKTRDPRRFLAAVRGVTSLRELQGLLAEK
ncbi:MAG: hypothetical protein RMK65_02130 [Anaerolineae bacterium]|nr:hypothetical protein [Anaerolineae bacterium]MCX8067431.1 hypothetical protein [Anaerolineae bacterium]MDW7990941.1 hypothetical protein [Anaerolineae bacterium]